jgi:hypothetical protein
MELLYHIVILLIILSLILQYLYNNPLKKALGIDYWAPNPLLWDNRTNPEENSKHLLDFYSLTHISHGLLFAIVSYLLFTSYFGNDRELNVIFHFYIVMGLEIIFEIIENTNFVINRFRFDGKNRHYTGDSYANIIGDLICCAIGFLVYVWLDSNIVMTGVILVVLETMLFYIFGDNMLMSFLSAVFPNTLS